MLFFSTLLSEWVRISGCGCVAVSLGPLLDWFAGGSDPSSRYMVLTHCMRGDYKWIALTVCLDLIVATGYGLIALHWWRNQRRLSNTSARRALGNMRNIFVFCGICGYLFIPIKMVWPAWRLYDMVVVVLAYFTWKYAWGAKDLKVIYDEIGRTTQLAEDLEKTREESRLKTSFLNALSHDLRTPLNGLMLQADVANASASAGDEAGLKSALEQMKSGAKATADLLDNLLEYARLDWSDESITKVDFELQDVLRTAVMQVKPAADLKGIGLKILAGPPSRVRTDRYRLERIMSNLLSNAVKFTHQGGVRVEVERSEAAVEIHVIDTGIGISAEHLRNLFEEFYQVDNHERDRKKGFGLGLAIARRLARQLGGEIIAQSNPGGGSRFSLLLPTVGIDADSRRGVVQPLAVVSAGS